MVLLPGSSTSTSVAKEIEANQNRTRSLESDSISGSPPPPYRFPLFPTVGSATETQQNQQEILVPHYTPLDVTMGGVEYSTINNNETNANGGRHGRHGFRGFGGRRCRRNHHGGDGLMDIDHRNRKECFKKYKRRKVFRKVLLRSLLFFTLTMIWLHQESVGQSVQKSIDALPQPILNLFTIIGHALYLPIAFSQILGILFYSTIISFLITMMHFKLRRRRMAKWRAYWHESLRARVTGGQQEHDHEAWPSSTGYPHHHHFHQHHPHSFHHHPHHHVKQQTLLQVDGDPSANVTHVESHSAYDSSDDDHEKSSTSSSSS